MMVLVGLAKYSSAAPCAPQTDPFKVLDPQNWVNPVRSRSFGATIVTYILLTMQLGQHDVG